MNGNPMNLEELAKALPMPCDFYNSGGGCMVVQVDLANGFSLIATDWATEEGGFDVGLYENWAEMNEPLEMFVSSSADVVGFITKIYNETKKA